MNHINEPPLFVLYGLGAEHYQARPRRGRGSYALPEAKAGKLHGLSKS